MAVTSINQSNVISPRTKKIVMSSQENTHKHQIPVKSIDNSKSLESTLRNRKLILERGKREKQQHPANEQMVQSLS